MPRVNQQVRVEVKDRGISSGRRTIDLTVSAEANLFILSDLLVKEGAIRDLDFVLKTSARRALSDYVLSGRTFVKTISDQKKESAQKMEE